MESRAVASKIELLDSDDEAFELLRSIAAAGPEKILPSLLRDPRSIVRLWALWAASEIGGSLGAAVLVSALRDRDSDVRDDALSKLMVVDREAARRELKMIRKKLRADDDFEIASAVWILAELGDVAALGHIDRIARDPPVAWLRKPAAVASMLLRGENGAILDRLRAHDHEMMKELAHGAAIMPSDEGLAVLLECSNLAIDKQCRGWCQWFAEWRLKRARTRDGGRLSDSGEPLTVRLPSRS